MGDPLSMVTSGMKAVSGLVGIGSTVMGGQLQAQAAGIKAQADINNIQGQMLTTIGRAYQFDVESQEFKYKSDVETYQAAVSLINQKIALQNANYEVDKGDVEAEQAGMQSRYELGQAKAAQAASGIDIGSGSSTAVRESMIEVGNYNQALIRANASKIAYGYDIQATQAEAEAAVHTMTASLDTAQAANASTAAGITREALPLEQRAMGLAAQDGQIGVESSMVNMAGSVASKWMQADFLGMLKPSSASSGSGTSIS